VRSSCAGSRIGDRLAGLLPSHGVRSGDRGPRRGCRRVLCPWQHVLVSRRIRYGSILGLRCCISEGARPPSCSGAPYAGLCMLWTAPEMGCSKTPGASVRAPNEGMVSGSPLSIHLFWCDAWGYWLARTVGTAVCCGFEDDFPGLRHT
jgi:hypothetical protein